MTDRVALPLYSVPDAGVLVCGTTVLAAKPNIAARAGRAQHTRSFLSKSNASVLQYERHVHICTHSQENRVTRTGN